jgi:hypothetical protein
MAFQNSMDARLQIGDIVWAKLLVFHLAQTHDLLDSEKARRVLVCVASIGFKPAKRLLLTSGLYRPCSDVWEVRCLNGQ